MKYFIATVFLASATIPASSQTNMPSQAELSIQFEEAAWPALVNACATYTEQLKSLCQRATAEALRRMASRLDESGRANMAQAAPQEISIIEFRVGGKSLLGQRVVINGTVTMVGAMVMLQSSASDLNPIFLKIDEIPQSDRRLLFTKCQPSCRSRITGTVTDVMAQVGIDAERFEVR